MDNYTVALIEEAVTGLLNHLDPSPNRSGLVETPERVAKAWAEWCAGYEQDPAEHMKCFDEVDYDEMVIVRDIPLYSTCEHHLAAIFGTATVGYVPDGRVLGLSKVARIVDVFARRLQVQERLTVQIADAIYGDRVDPAVSKVSSQVIGSSTGLVRPPEALWPRGVGVIVRARHLCMESRGVCKQGHHTVTSALRGVMREGEPRAEFLRLATAGG